MSENENLDLDTLNDPSSSDSDVLPAEERDPSYDVEKANPPDEPSEVNQTEDQKPPNENDRVSSSDCESPCLSSSTHSKPSTLVGARHYKEQELGSDDPPPPAVQPASLLQLQQHCMAALLETNSQPRLPSLFEEARKRHLTTGTHEKIVPSKLFQPQPTRRTFDLLEDDASGILRNPIVPSAFLVSLPQRTLQPLHCVEPQGTEDMTTSPEFQKGVYPTTTVHLKSPKQLLSLHRSQQADLFHERHLQAQVAQRKADEKDKSKPVLFSRFGLANKLEAPDLMQDYYSLQQRELAPLGSTQRAVNQLLAMARKRDLTPPPRLAPVDLPRSCSKSIPSQEETSPLRKGKSSSKKKVAQQLQKKTFVSSSADGALLQQIPKALRKYANFPTTEEELKEREERDKKMRQFRKETVMRKRQRENEIDALIDETLQRKLFLMQRQEAQELRRKEDAEKEAEAKRKRGIM